MKGEDEKKGIDLGPRMLKQTALSQAVRKDPGKNNIDSL